ncbi:hypothetical protein ACS780_03760 [Yersinia enterocolitica]|uniref:hypothetical protein n=1 Tax=Yersinia enterocolitica TaxID=630 RepID=UPI003F46F30B
MKLSDGVIVLIITACSYLFSYAFYAGYYVTKNIPIDFITIDFIAMLKIGFTICIFICMATMFTDNINFSEDTSALSSNTKLFIIRNLMNFIVGFLIIINTLLTLDFSPLVVYCALMHFSLKKEIEFKQKNQETVWYKRRYSLVTLPPRKLGTIFIAEKLKIKSYYVIFTWFLAAIAFSYYIGTTSANLFNVNILCNDDFDVIQMNGDNVLITKDYKTFEFISKTNCKFISVNNKK